MLKSLDNSKFSQLRPWTTELAAIECQKKNPYGYKGEIGVATFSEPSPFFTYR